LITFGISFNKCVYTVKYSFSSSFSMNPKLKIILYGLSVFVIYTIVAIALRMITHHVPTEDEYFGLISNKDLYLGLLLAIVLTFTHVQKKRLK
jgi:hypothetical protein